MRGVEGLKLELDKMVKIPALSRNVMVRWAALGDAKKARG
jgi:hypothetical protein